MRNNGQHAVPKRIQEYTVATQYYAPRGKERLLNLGEQIAQRHLSYTDRLIGFIGDSGSGKSSLIRGIFPGLELTNDDDILSPRKLMQVRDFSETVPTASTYHIDMRFQTAFTQMYEITDFVTRRLEEGRRIVVEHFNLLAPALGRNADLLIAIGEEIIVTRPTIFGPQPDRLYDIVHTSLRYRKMAHTAEEITSIALFELFGLGVHEYYSADVRNGYVLKFNEKPHIDLALLEKRIKELIDQDLPVNYHDEDEITVGELVLPCEGPRLHVHSTGDIENFRVYPELVYDKRYDAWCLVGLIGDDGASAEDIDLSNRNTDYFLR